ncbi:MAG: response regulator [Thermoanaerobaculaceae bacterium]|nr:response regulator [Thermoanaerobaculaceae bacterium]MDI9621092.1 response regulator [Acidobacteriota bacterium]NLH09912.1 response regulator [Holophagae bacterium]HPW55527.1 response regulator [Thermoanaerobaculaceae bacterium]
MGGTILLADDSITIQKVVELTFGETDHQVVALSSGRELLRRLPEVRPDVVLCDVVMPDLNGYEVCQTLKSDPSTLHIPVALLTGTFEPFDRDRALAAGCDAIVTKPFEGRELVTVVEDLIRRASAPQVAEPEPSFFPGLGVPDGVPGIEFTTTGFDQMVPEAPAEPQIPDHGIEMTGVGERPSEPTPSAEPGCEPGGSSEAAPAVEGEASAATYDSWIKRLEAEKPEVGSMHGDFFESSEAPVPVPEELAPEPTAAVTDDEPPPLLQAWEESAELQARSVEAPFDASAEPAAFEQPPAVGATEVAPEVGALPAPEDAHALADFGPPPAWEETEAREEPVIGTWPADPAPPATVQELPQLNPARESIAAAWEVSRSATAEAAELAGGSPLLPEEDAFQTHPEPGFEVGIGTSEATATEQAPVAEPQPPITELRQEALTEPIADLVAPEEARPVAAPEPIPAPPEAAIPEVVDGSMPLAIGPGETPQPELEVFSAETAEPALPEPAAEDWLPGTEVPPAQPVSEPEPLAAAPEPLLEAVPVPEPATEPIAEPAPTATAGEPVPEAIPTLAMAPPTAETAMPEPTAGATPVSDELIGLVADRVLARIPQTSFVELTDAQITAVAERAVLLIPPPPPPELPPLSYELEEGDIQRVAARIMEVLPPPPPPKLAEEEVEYVAHRALELLPAPVPPPVELSDSEINRVVGHVLGALPEPPPPVLPESEIARVLERVKAILPAAEPTPASTSGELSEAALEQVAQRVLQLATPIIERIAWEILPDMAEMLVRRRIAELEQDAE